MKTTNSQLTKEVEIEAKFYPVEKTQIRKLLEEKGFECTYPERMMRRTVFDHNDNPQVDAHYIRVRDEGDAGTTISAKVHASQDGDILDQKELVTTVEDYDTAVEILKTSGLKVSAYQETLRETWELVDEGGVTEVVIDTWPKLKPYIEIETYSEARLKGMTTLLGFKWEDRIITSVIGVYMKELGWSKEETFNFIKDLRLK